MRQLSMIVAFGLAAGACFGQESSRPMPEVVRENLPLLSAGLESRRLRAVQALADSRTMEGWRELLVSYADQPVAVRVAILRLIEELPEVKEYWEEADRHKALLDALVVDAGKGGYSKKELEGRLDSYYRFAKEIDALQDSIEKTSMRFSILVRNVVTRSNVDPSVEVRSALLDAVTKFLPCFGCSRSPQYWRCGSGPIIFRMLNWEIVSDALRSYAREHSGELLQLVKGKLPSYERAAILLADVRCVELRPVLEEWLRGSEYKLTSLAYTGVFLYPFDSALPLVIRRLKYVGTEVREGVWEALQGYGSKGIKAVEQVWPELTSEGKEEALRAFEFERTTDAFRLALLAMRDSEVAERGMDVMVEMLGIDPGDDEDTYAPTAQEWSRLRAQLMGMLAIPDLEDLARERLESWFGMKFGAGKGGE